MSELVLRIINFSPVVDRDELEEVLALPLAGEEHHQGAPSGSVGPQAGHEGLEHLEVGGSGQHYRGLSENIQWGYIPANLVIDAVILILYVTTVIFSTESQKVCKFLCQ